MYILFCVVMLVLQPQMNIEPVACLVSFIHWRRGGRREGGGWEDMRDWVTWGLCCAHRTGHKAKVNWRENQKVGKFPYHKKIPFITVDILLHNVCSL